MELRPGAKVAAEDITAMLNTISKVCCDALNRKKQPVTKRQKKLILHASKTKTGKLAIFIVAQDYGQSLKGNGFSSVWYNIYEKI